eukprot:TRINITY_DN17545_c0_g1_i1.p1 TRINITY_DN17545_c0_g1~~TRINITY_DN17545_c0_g1_i1.p1  ORF type:complete len:997 (+),score=164.50 TRINITY_DN17545_c0_g1_i1:45-2993(+)
MPVSGSSGKPMKPPVLEPEPTIPEGRREVDEEEEEETVENIIVRFPKEQVEELVNYLIMQLMEQGLGEQEASEKAAEILDDPAAQLIMAKELNKPVLNRILTEFYTEHDPEKVHQVVDEVDAFTGRTRDLLEILAEQYKDSPEALQKLEALSDVADEEQDWVAVTERSSSRSLSSRPSAPGSNSARKFLTNFYARFDPSKTVSDIDETLNGYQGALPELRKVLSEEYRKSPDTLDYLLKKFKVGPYDSISSRQAWLASNVKHARKHYKENRTVTEFLNNLQASKGFVAYVGFWLAASLAFVAMYLVHLQMMMLMEMFLPSSDRGGWQSIGLFVCFVMSLHAVSSFLTVGFRSVTGWVFQTEEIYYGDIDYSGGENVVPPHVRSSLPPCTRRTILNLPVGGYVRKQQYITCAVLGFVVAPILRMVLESVVNGTDFLRCLSVGVQWNIVASLTLFAAVWSYGWTVSAKRKWTSRKLKETGLDTPSLRRSVLLLSFAFCTIFILFWLASRSTPVMSLSWTLITLIILLSLFGLRETWRHSSYHRFTPYVAAGLLAVFLIVGLIGCAVTSGETLLLFGGLFVVTQGMMLKHVVDETEDREEYITRAVSKLSCHEDEEGIDVDEATPLKLPQVKSEPRSDTTASLARSTTRYQKASWVPCGGVLRAFFAFPCKHSPVPPPDAKPNRTAPLSKEAHPKGSIVLLVNCRVTLWIMLGLLAWSAVVFEVASTTQDGAAGELVSSRPPPLCAVKVRNANLTVPDLAVLAQLSHEQDYPSFVEKFQTSNLHNVKLQIPQDQTAERLFSPDFNEDRTQEVAWLHFTQDKHNILVIRSDVRGQLLVRDLQAWGIYGFFSVVKYVVPVLNLFGEGFVSELDTIPEAFASKSHYTELSSLTSGLLSNGSSVTVVGYGLAGGFAARQPDPNPGLQTVTFNSPTVPSPYHLSVAAEKNLYTPLMVSPPGTQLLPCSLSHYECSSMGYLVSALQSLCPQ